MGFSDGATSARSRATPGAGGTTSAARVGAERVWSAEILGAGATTFVFNAGAKSTWSRETVGAGGITDPGEAALREKSVARLGTGAITLEARSGAVRAERRPSVGGGPASGRTAIKFATAFGEDGSLSLGASRTLSVREPPRAILMVWVRWCASVPPAVPAAPAWAPPKSSVGGSSSPE